MALNYETEESGISKATEEICQESQRELENIISLSDTNILFKFANILGKIHNRLWLCELMVKVAVKAEQRRKYNDSISALKQLKSKIFVNRQLYDILSALKDRFAGDDLRFLNTLLLQFERNGTSLGPDLQEQYKEVSQQIADKSTQFLLNVNEDVSFVLATREELEGLPEDFINNLKKNEDVLCIITMKYPDSLPVLKKCKIATTRKRVKECMDSRCANTNMKLLEEVVILREKLGHILGYPTWSAYRLEEKMAKTPKNVEEFQSKIQQKLIPLATEELNTLLKLKKEHDPNATKIEDWDLAFYMNQFVEHKYGIDDEEIRKYFPFERITEQILGVYQEILGLKFDEIPHNESNAWHPEVKFFRVTDVENDNQLLGHFYLDLFPRDGKYSHACAYPVVDGFNFFDNQGNPVWQYPVAVMVANFTKPTSTRPSLLTHSEVKTYCHEFGHVMHSLCAKAKYCENTWFHTPMDFVEAPSQMLENWIWEKQVLKRISGHYQNGEPLPDDVIEKMVRSKNACIGLLKLRQIFMASYDMTLHSKGSSLLSNANQNNDNGTTIHPLCQLWDDMKKSIALVEGVPNTSYPASWLHLCADYDAGYYGYLWSEVFAADMFSRFVAEGVLNQTVGRAYRNYIIQPSDSARVEEFLGRKPNEEAFLKSLGISNSK